MYEVPTRIKGAVDSIMAECTQHIQTLLGNHVVPKLIIVSANANTSTIMALVCDEFGITEEELKSSTKKQEVVEARFAFVYLCNLYTEECPDVLMAMVNKTRTTFYHMIDAVERRLFTKDEYFCTRFNKINQLIKNENKAN